MNLAAVFDRRDGDDIALLSRGKPTTYAQLHEQAGAYRAGLRASGLEPGDRLAILVGNNWYFVASYLAALGGGFVAVPLNPSSPPAELEAELAAVGARADGDRSGSA